MRIGTYREGVALVVTAAVLWSLMGLVIRQIDVAGTWQVLFYRSLGALPMLLVILLLTGRQPPLRRIMAVGLPGLIGGLGLVIAFAGAIFALQHTTIANAMFLYAATPPITAVLGLILLGERVRPITWLSIALAGLGIFVMVREGLSTGALAGNLAALLSSVGFAVFTLALRWGRLVDMIPAALVGALLSMAVAAMVAYGSGQSLAVPLRDAGIAMALGTFILGLGMGFYTLGSRVIPAAELGLLLLLEVMLAPIWVWLAIGETASPATLAGGAILLGAILLNALSGLRRRRAMA